MVDYDFIVNLLSAMIRNATPIALAAIGAVVCERSGVVNIAMEGIMTVGAFVAAIVAGATGNPWIGLLAAIFFGGLFSLIHAFATVSLHLDHVVSGAVRWAWGQMPSSLTAAALGSDVTLATPLVNGL